jgi:hypothetical protein
VLYANPFHAELWTSAGFVELKRGPTFALLGAPPADAPAQRDPRTG